MSHGGADLSYDFITRPAYHHALVTGDTEFLRLMLKTMRDYDIDPASLIHALQNHDELTLELVHFWTLHAKDTYTFGGQTWTGETLREHLRATMYERLTGDNAPYNLRFVTNGVACTTASVIAAALNIRDLDMPDRSAKAPDPARPSAARDVQCLSARRLRAVRLGSGRRVAAAPRSSRRADGRRRYPLDRARRV